MKLLTALVCLFVVRHPTSPVLAVPTSSPKVVTVPLHKRPPSDLVLRHDYRRYLGFFQSLIGTESKRTENDDA